MVFRNTFSPPPPLSLSLSLSSLSLSFSLFLFHSLSLSFSLSLPFFLLYLVPQITEKPDSLENAVPGQPAEFAANAIGKDLSYTWYRQATKQLSKTDQRVIVGNTRILRIEKVESSNEGYYVCLISNPTGGTVETSPAQLTTSM